MKLSENRDKYGTASYSARVKSVNVCRTRTALYTQRSRQEFQYAWRKSAQRKVEIITGGGVYSARKRRRACRARAGGRAGRGDVEAGKLTVF